MADQMTPAEMREQAKRLRRGAPDSDQLAGADALDRLADGPRVITTEPEVNALPVGTIIRDNMGDARQKVSERGWEQAGESGRWGPTWVAFPATVLYTPDWADDAGEVCDVS